MSSRIQRRANTRNRKVIRERRTKVVQSKREFTRAKAEHLIAQTTDPEVLKSERISGHGNKHVTKKAKHKLTKLEAELAKLEAAPLGS